MEKVCTSDVESVMALMRRIDEEYKEAAAEIDWCDKKTQDILHDLELVDHSYHEQAKLSRELADIRKRRRVAKNQMELLEPAVTWKSEQSGPLTKLSNVIGKMRKIDDKHKNALYYRRADGEGAIIRG